jgi:hypothetical protein
MRKMFIIYSKKLFLTELKNFTDYQKFIVLDSKESISTGHQKIPHHMVFADKDDRRSVARLVTGGNWTINQTEDIY